MQETFPWFEIPGLYSDRVPRRRELPSNPLRPWAINLGVADEEVERRQHEPIRELRILFADTTLQPFYPAILILSCKGFEVANVMRYQKEIKIGPISF